MKLPLELTICDRPYTVLVKRSRKKAGGGAGDWHRQLIHVWVWDGTTFSEALDTLFHEALELDAISRKIRYDAEDRILFVYDHDTFQARQALCVRIMEAVARANAWAVDFSGQVEV